jgi:hypothetical protein
MTTPHDLKGEGKPDLDPDLVVAAMKSINEAPYPLTAEEIQSACDESRRRMNGYSPEQRKALYEGALKTIFPDGYWCCSCNVLVAAGRLCPVCNPNSYGNALTTDGKGDR